MKIRNIIIFILLLLGVYFLYSLKEGLTVQEAQKALDDANLELNAATNRNIPQLTDKVNEDYNLLTWNIQNNGGYKNIMATLNSFRNSIVDLESKKSNDIVPLLTQKVELAKKNLDTAIQQVTFENNLTNQRTTFANELTNQKTALLNDFSNQRNELEKQKVDLQNRNTKLNTIVQDEKEASKKLIVDSVNNQRNVDKINYDKFLQENYSYFESLTKNAKQIVDNQINNIAKLKKQAIDNNFFINEAPKVRTAKITSDNYADPECPDGEFLYCTGDKIVCEDIFGNPIDTMTEKDNGNGKTYSGCGSGLKNKTYEQFLDDMTIGLTVQGNQSLFYDISLCPSDKPWRVDMSAGDLSFNIVNELSGNDLSGIYVKNNYQCYKNSKIASAISKFNDKNPTNLYIDSDVYIDGDYLYDKYKDDRLFKLIRSQTKVWVNNKACYKGIIKDITSNNTFDVYVPDYEGQLFKDISSKYLYTINLDYSNDLNKTLTDLKMGSLPRPVCKNGVFTDKCSKKRPETIYFENKDKISYSADAFPLLGEGSEESCANKLTFSSY